MHTSSGRLIIGTVLLMLLAGCGSQSSGSASTGSAPTTSSSQPAQLAPVETAAASSSQSSAQLPACANAGAAAALPAKFPAAFPLPPGTVVISQEERSGERIIINTIVPLDVKEVAEFFERELPKAGFTPDQGESETGDAEASFEGNGYRGRWKATNINGCPNTVTLTVLTGP